MAKRDYLVEAAKQIRMALDREVNEDYEAAFSYYKNGVDLLLNGVQVDPNKERREAVKRKTTQYLKRAEEIFISHLQDNLGKGNPHLGGYSSLRFRPIRHLSSPVEDLEMCKVVGIIDKVLIVQSLINKETFVVKSLPKSSWESRDQPTVIPQGVPFMVKLLRYYVSEDAVYLHLEHVQGVRLFSKLHKARTDRAKEHPDCFSQNRTRLKTSYTSPSLSADYQHGHSCSGLGPVQECEAGDSPDGLASWDEAQQRLDSYGTHSYCEETGCLQNLRPAPSSLSGPIRTGVGSHVPPVSSQQLSFESQANPDGPIQPFIGQSLEVVSELPRMAGGLGLVEACSDFDEAWNAADPTRPGQTEAPCGARDTHAAAGSSVLHTTQTSFGEAGFITNMESLGISSSTGCSSPATLHLPLHSQSQVILSTSASQFGRSSTRELDASTGLVGTSHRAAGPHGDAGEENVVKPDLRDSSQPGRAACSASLEVRTSSGNSQCSCRTGAQQGHPAGISLAISGVKYHVGPGEEVEEGWELLSPGGKDAPHIQGSLCSTDPTAPPGASPQCRRGDMDAFLKSEGSEGQGEDQMIEVEGWCHLPQFPDRSSRGREAARAGGWGLPEGKVRLWGAQILLALESLHQQGVICRDLNPNNILLTNNGKVCMTFFGQWSEVQLEISSMAMEQMYCAPEIGGVAKITEACDWWSLGALLFELLTGTALWRFHPAGVRSHTQLLIPDHLSTAAASLLTELLQFDAGYRLGSGGGGVSDIKCHPFFSGVPWQSLSS
ncbi:ribosomal protein S6 kinase delta-1 [Hypomesus transpacificus]|uniref:ribosomal protein S6 kinase delta-1 n=1 Tax=Hypomesus transpacificus TaxID=137520 RepID=UPI001F07AF79|nr:ribosomal protein S6 kinase delta-1 [Hypomesus transpacificus]XP_046904150.1 ribosomal protein S6 kinase delta-1 [Hypomesus transpacificus]XP_046904160.1 ribosomal protein S6 kinase delta-1 [Hypomesus transpacificus]